jgi:hypothetical protein
MGSFTGWAELAVKVAQAQELETRALPVAPVVWRFLFLLQFRLTTPVE